MPLLITPSTGLGNALAFEAEEDESRALRFTHGMSSDGWHAGWPAGFESMRAPGARPGHPMGMNGQPIAASASSPSAWTSSASMPAAIRVHHPDDIGGQAALLLRPVEQPELVAGHQHLDRLPRGAVVGRQPVGPDRVAVLLRRVALVAVPAVDRVAGMRAWPSSGRGRPSRRPTHRRSSRRGRRRRRSRCTDRPAARSRRSGCRRRGRGRGRRGGRSRGASRDGSRGRC